MNQTASTPPLADVLTDVTIREGSQQVDDLRQVDVQTKLSLLGHMVKIGIRRVEITAFAPGKWFADADELVRGALPRITENVTLRALYFNAKGLEQLLKHPAIEKKLPVVCMLRPSSSAIARRATAEVQNRSR